MDQSEKVRFDLRRATVSFIAFSTSRRRTCT